MDKAIGDEVTASTHIVRLGGAMPPGDRLNNVK